MTKVQPTKAGEMAALPKDPGLIPSTRMVAYTSVTPVPRGIRPPSGL